MNTAKYEKLFISEAIDYIEQISDSILQLEKDPDNIESVNSIFRGLHTIKGMAASMGYGDITQIAHQLEDIVDLVKSGKIELYRELIDILLKGNDYMEMLVRKKTIDPDILRSFRSVLNSIKAGSDKNTEFKENKSIKIVTGNVLDIIFENDVVLKSARAFVVMKAIQDTGYYYDCAPSYNDILEGNFEKSFKVELKENAPIKELIKQIKSIPEIMDVKHLAEKQIKNEIEDKSYDIDESGIKVKNDIRVSLDRLDNLQNFASELVIARGRLQQLAYGLQDNELINSLNNTSKIIANIQDEVMKIRMVPVWQVFDRYPRYIRDLANKLNKNINFEIKGRSIELDRSLLNTLADPLLHLLKNSVDHGIELPEIRVSVNKSEQGTLILEAKRLKNAILISVTDDGKGIDENRILIIAIKKGIVTEEQAKNMSKQEILNFITYSGFSTRDKANDISGRGVGVDAVKNILKKIGGTFEIHSEYGKGTTFNLKVPLTLAIIKSLNIRVEKERYIIPLTHINETIDIPTSRIQTIMGREVFVLREEVIPIIRLSDIFNIETIEEKTKYSLVIVNVEDNDFALLIDEFIEQTEIVVKSLKGVLSDIKGLAGITILNDGMPSFIIDVPSIFEMAKVR